MNFRYVHSAEKARETTLNDEKYDVRYSLRWQIECPLSNQPEAFASDLGDNQSLYL